MWTNTIFVLLGGCLNAAVALSGHVCVVAWFGASPETDVFYLATTVPIAMISVFASMAPAILVPRHAAVLAAQGTEAARLFAGRLIAVAAAGSAALALTIYLGAPAAAAFLLRRPDPAQLPLAAQLLRDCTLMVGCMSFSSALSALHNAGARFRLAALSAGIVPVTSILFMMAGREDLGIRSASLGLSAGALLQACVLAAYAFPMAAFDRRALFPGAAELRSLLPAAAPLLATGIAYHYGPLLERQIASALPSGSVTHLTLASKIAVLAPALIGNAVGTTLLPLLSQQANRSRHSEAVSTLSAVLRALALLGIPLVLFSVLYSSALSRFLLARGRLTESDAEAVAALLPFYLAGAVAWAGCNVVFRGYYALAQDHWTPAALTALTLGPYYLLCREAAARHGSQGVAAAYGIYWSVVILAATGLLAVRLRRFVSSELARGTGAAVGKALAGSLLLCAASAYLSGRLSNFNWGPVAASFLGIACYFLFVWRSGALAPLLDRRSGS
ncbi:MAG: hypothetical protein IT429_18730 [Gemmataceae bacterium]|nr:hypothetical protein [Gemmataceae bacterium]